VPPRRWAFALLPVALLVAVNFAGVHPADRGHPRHYEASAREDDVEAGWAGEFEEFWGVGRDIGELETSFTRDLDIGERNCTELRPPHARQDQPRNGQLTGAAGPVMSRPGSPSASSASIIRKVSSCAELALGDPGKYPTP